MKGTKISSYSTQNNEVLNGLYNKALTRVRSYIETEEDVVDTKDTISAYNLYNIVKGYYEPLESVMSAESEELEDIIADINEYLNGEPKKVINFRRSNKLTDGINDLLGKISGNGKSISGKTYLNIRFYIREDSTSAVLEYVEEGKHKKVVICRDLVSQDLYYGKSSSTDYDVVDHIYTRLIGAFDLIDSYRNKLPEQVDTDISYDDFACKPYEYARFSVPFANDFLQGEVYVNSNGYVDTDVNLAGEAGYTRIDTYTKSVKALINENKLDILRKIPVKVSTLEEPIKDIVESSLANNRNLGKIVG